MTSCRISSSALATTARPLAPPNIITKGLTKPNITATPAAINKAGNTFGSISNDTKQASVILAFLSG